MADTTDSRPLVLVFGGTGHTAVVIINGLVKSGAFRVATAVRASSLSKPVVVEYRKNNVIIHEADIDDGVEKLAKVLHGVDVLISTITARKILSQRDLFAAAKQIGVKRVIPCDFGTPGARGVRDLLDEKLEIHDYIKSLGLGYTFIDIGWWMQISLPCRSTSKSMMRDASRQLYNGGVKKILVTNLDNVGVYVAHVIADERTLNHSVLIWEDQVTALQAMEIGAKVSGEGSALIENVAHVSANELLERIAAAKEEYAKTHSFVSFATKTGYQYQYSIHVLGENSLENAKALGYLDSRELYPDIIPDTLENYAPKFYENEYIL
ncbi:NAD-P-binding protein [Sparassis latifolia]